MKFFCAIIVPVIILFSGCNEAIITGPSGSLGYKIAYFTYSHKFDSLRVVGVDGSNDYAVAPFHGTGSSVDWFPNGSALIFSDMVYNPMTDTAWAWLYEFRTGQKRLLFSTIMNGIGGLTVSPDGRMIACIIYPYDNSGAVLSVFDASGGNRRSLTQSDQFAADCQWSPDASQILFTLDTNICTIRPDGSQFSRLTSGPGCKTNPSYSPDGTQIVYWLHDYNGFQTICVMNADGTSPHLITPLEQKVRALPKWSPDGKYIAYIQTDSLLIMRVFRMDSEGDNVRQLSTGSGNQFIPRWVPDSRIVYVSNDPNNLWIVDKDGVESRQITNIPAGLGGTNLTFAISKSMMP